MRYEAISPIDRAEATVALGSGNPELMTDALIRLAFHDPDWRWVQGICLDLLTNRNVEVRRLAAICLGHLARIHKQLDTHFVLPALRDAAADELIRGDVHDAIDDIRQYIGSRE